MHNLFLSSRISTTLKILGVVAMTIDHIGAVFFPEQLLWRLIGRLALPLFIFGVIEGSRHTRHHGRYILRLLICALVAQPFFAYLFDPAMLNICFSLILYVATAYCLRHTLHRIEQVAIIALSLVAASLLPIDYGMYGMLFFLILYGVRIHSRENASSFANLFWPIAITLLHVANIFTAYLTADLEMLIQAFVQSTSLVGAACISIFWLAETQKPQSHGTSASKHSYAQPLIIRYAFYIYYPLHLAVIAGVFAWLYN